nr:MAG TPA: hypothetical protein [Microviridae sp.]
MVSYKINQGFIHSHLSHKLSNVSVVLHISS